MLQRHQNGVVVYILFLCDLLPCFAVEKHASKCVTDHVINAAPIIQPRMCLGCLLPQLGASNASTVALLLCLPVTCVDWSMQRDIPMPLVSSGVEKGNLRELALARMGDLGLQCRDVRTREAGIQDIHHKVPTALHAHSYTLCLCTSSLLLEQCCCL